MLKMIFAGFWLLCVMSCEDESAKKVNVENLVKPGQENILKALVASEEQESIPDLIVFGDSLSDRGRLHRRSLGIYIPGDVYWRGRVTNGPNGTDYACGALHCENRNYAVAGAGTRLHSYPLRWILRPLDAQVDEFFGESYPAAMDKAVAVIWIGANNYLSRPDPNPDEARDDIREAARRLLRGPVQRLLLATMPQLAGILPSPYRVDNTPFDVYRRSTDDHNHIIRQLVTEMQQEFPQKSIALFDAYKINQATIDFYQNFAFTTLKEACYQGNYKGEFFKERAFCSQPLGVKFWDYTHPNSRMHCYYAAQFLMSLNQAGWLKSFDGDKAIEVCRGL